MDLVLFESMRCVFLWVLYLELATLESIWMASYTNIISQPNLVTSKASPYLSKHKNRGRSRISNLYHFEICVTMYRYDMLKNAENFSCSFKLEKLFINWERYMMRKPKALGKIWAKIFFLILSCVLVVGTWMKKILLMLIKNILNLPT